MAWFIGIPKRGIPEVFNKVKINKEDFFRYKRIFGPYLHQPKTVAAIKSGRELTLKNYKMVHENPKSRGYDVGMTTDDSLMIDEDLAEYDPYSEGTVIYSKRKRNPQKKENKYEIKVRDYDKKWLDVGEYIFRSWSGKRRLNGKIYKGPVYYLGSKDKFERKNPAKSKKRIWYIVQYPRGGGKIVRGPKKSIWKKKYPGPIQGPYYLDEVRHLMQ